MNIMLYIIHHKDIELPKASFLLPIRSDRNDGNSIASKVEYCELRAQYWVWKNVQASDNDYVGFFHYRRYLDFGIKSPLSLPRQSRPLPYRISKMPKTQDYAANAISKCIEGFDVIAPIWEYTGLTVWERYGRSQGQRSEDLQIIYEILKEHYPEFVPAADTYLSGKGEYYGNIFIMRRTLFIDYCNWLFAILEEFDCRVVSPPPRSNGYLGERLFGIYFTWLQSQIGVKAGELPRLHFSCYDDKEHQFAFQKIFNLLLPPGSRFRSFMHSFIK